VDPEKQKLVITVCVGLLVLFPVFNQVAYAVVDALTSADHETRMSDFFKSWDRIPEDRKLEYWDGRNVPPGQWDGSADDASIRGGAGGGGGNGGENGEDGTDPDEERPPPRRYIEEELYLFIGGATERQDRVSIGTGQDYAWLNITWAYAGFNGEADFQVYVAGQSEWQHSVGSANLPAFFAGDDDNDSIEEPGRAALEFAFTYKPVPLGAPTDFQVRITGTYLEP
jgi:hypothetical protein